MYRVYPLDPLPATKWDLIAWLAAGTVGVIVVQLAGKAGKKEVWIA